MRCITIPIRGIVRWLSAAMRLSTSYPYTTQSCLWVAEVDRPNRQLRRHRGQSDAIDAEAAARAALAQDALRIPMSQDGTIETQRVIRLQRRAAMPARTHAGNQLHAVVASAPDAIRHRLREHSLAPLVAQFRQHRRRCTNTPLEQTTHATLRGLARHWTQPDAENRAASRAALAPRPCVRPCAAGSTRRWPGRGRGADSGRGR